MFLYIFIFNFFLLSLFSSIFSMMLKFNFFTEISTFFFILESNFNFDSFSFNFLVMVCLVSSIVFFFSSLYMNSYDFKKFIFLLSFFIFSMIFLILGCSILNISLGWDFLGLSSILLIMFYPNKITMYNSYLTFLFNRLSDIFVITIFGIFLVMMFSSFNLNQISSSIFIFFLSLCSFIKSAQFPFSSWLPAAMSAPTPISALVHSSTLVTAGVLILLKVLSFIDFFSFSKVFIFFTFLGIFVGGFLASIELDLKKMVAFSTMSQISVVLTIGLFFLVYLSLAHMLFHAFFKSFLFISCGLTFLTFFSSQVSLNFSTDQIDKIFPVFFFFSIFSMTGLLFSSSFWTKDLFLEFLSCEHSNFDFFIFLFSSGLTVLYCSVMMSFLSTGGSNFPGKEKFFFSFFFYMLFSFFLLLLWVLSSNLFLKENFFSMSVVDLIFLVLFFMPFLLLKIYSKYTFLFKFSLDIFFMKSWSFSYFSTLLMSSSLNSSFSSDHMFMKPSLISLKFNLYDFKFNGVFYIFFLVLFMF